MASGILKVDGILPQKITAITADGTSYPLKKLSDSEGRVLWENGYKFMVISSSNWDNLTVGGLTWHLDAITDEGLFKLSSYGFWQSGFRGNSDIISFKFPEMYKDDNMHSLRNGFQNCVNLESLDLSNNVFDGDDWAYLIGSCKAFKELNISKCTITNINLTNAFLTYSPRYIIRAIECEGDDNLENSLSDLNRFGIATVIRE